VLAAELAYRLAGGHGRRERLAAAAFAALSLALLADPFTAWLRQGAEGMSEPLLVALVLGALRAGLGGFVRGALALGALAALLRPEGWPLLALYGLWLWRRDRPARPLIVALAGAVPALWLGPDLLSSGDALGGAERAQRGDGGALQALLEVLARAAQLPLAAAWPLAALAILRRAPRTAVLAAGALAWIAIVAVMAVAGFAGLPRFMAPAAAVAGILGGVGLARLLALAGGRGPQRRALPAVALAAVVASLALQLPPRGEQLREAARATARIGHSHDRLRALARADGGRPALLRCGRLSTSDVLVRTALSWQLDVPLADVVSFGTPPRRSGAFVVGPRASPRLRLGTAARAELRAQLGEWRVYSLKCPATATASASASARSAGVSGARR